MVFDSFTFRGRKRIKNASRHEKMNSESQTHQDVVRLDVGVEDVASFEQLESQEELLAVGAHRLDVQAHVFPVLLQHLSQVHAGG